MSFVSDGIDRVRAFGLAAGVSADGRTVDAPQSVLVKWRSEYKDKLHQVYINGKFAGVTGSCRERMMVVAIPSEHTTAVCIEVYAVDSSRGNVDFSEDIKLVNQACRVRIQWPRFLSLPFEGCANIYSDYGEGGIDYETVLNTERIRLWPAWQDKGGFGLCRFAQSDFGFDGSAAVGFGLGSFGYGEFGFDADLITWDSGELETGLYKFAVKIIDRFGNSSSASETEEILVIRPARPAESLEVDSYEQEQDELLLSVG